jgi:protein MPE1
MSSSVYYKFKSQRQESRVQFDGTGISVFDLKKEIILQNNLKASDIDLFVLDTNDQGAVLCGLLISISYLIPHPEYKDDSFIIPRSTSVIARRIPAIRPGKGRAQIYVANAGNSGNPAPETQARSGSANPPSMGSGGQGPAGGRFGPMSRRFDGRDQKPTISSAPPSSSVVIPHSIYPERSFDNRDHQSTPQPPIAPAGGDDEAASIAAMFAETSEQWEATQERMAQLVTKSSNDHFELLTMSPD